MIFSKSPTICSTSQTFHAETASRSSLQRHTCVHQHVESHYHLPSHHHKPHFPSPVLLSSNSSLSTTKRHHTLARPPITTGLDLSSATKKSSIEEWVAVIRGQSRVLMRIELTGSILVRLRRWQALRNAIAWPQYQHNFEHLQPL